MSRQGRASSTRTPPRIATTTFGSAGCSRSWDWRTSLSACCSCGDSAGPGRAARYTGGGARGRPGTTIVFTSRVDRQRLSSIAHSHHPIAAPIFGVNVNRLLRRADRQPAARILDLGCGEAAWALQALVHYPDGHADGVDVSRYALERAGAAAAQRDLADRLTLHERDARGYVPDGSYDLVLCVGTTHVFGGFAETLARAGQHVHPDGILMVGEGFWQAPPTPAALAALNATPEDYTDLAGLVDVAEQTGWTPVYAHISDAAEWDNYEWSWIGSLTEWALDNPGHPDAHAALALAREHRDQWLRGYRQVLGFVTLVLRRM
jgi:SAM-dependent methyltransferase